MKDQSNLWMKRGLTCTLYHINDLKDVIKLKCVFCDHFFYFSNEKNAASEVVKMLFDTLHLSFIY